MAFRCSIRHILHVFAGLAVLPALLIVVAGGISSRERVIDETRAAMSDSLDELVNRSLMLTENTQVLLAALSQAEALRDGRWEDLSALLRGLLGSRPEYENIFLSDGSGAIVASANPMRGEVKISQASYFRDALQRKDFFVSSLTEDPVTGNPVLPHVLPVAASSPEGGLLLVATLKPSSLIDQIGDFFSDNFLTLHLRDMRGGLVYVYPPLEDAGQDIYEDDAWQAIAGKDASRGEISVMSRSGRDYFLVYQRLSIPDMKIPYATIELSAVKRAVFAKGNGFLFGNLFLLGLIILALFNVISFIGNKILIEPARGLVQELTALAGGQRDALVTGKKFTDNLGGLAVAFEEMAEALKRRDQDLIAAKNAADAANKAKGEFLANMSHEIRTPMHAVIGMAHLALKTNLTPQQRIYVNKVYSAANALFGIIKDILDFSKIESGMLDMENSEFRLDDILDNIALLISQKAEEKDLELLFGVDDKVPPVLVGDPLRLGQVLTNLLNNAVKFTEKGEIIVSCTLDAAPVRPGRRRLRFMIKDTGIGMTREQQDKLFTAFTQADASITRRFGGTGLGLTITKRLLELMDGDIHILSEEGKGTTIIFTATFDLPLVQKENEDLRQGSLARVLVVDDNGPARRMLQDVLSEMHFKTDGAESPFAAFDMISQEDTTEEPYRIVLMDWRMPVMDGIEATWRLHNDLRLAHMPLVIITTTLGHGEILRQAKKAGAAGVLYKPVSRSVLLDSLMDVMHSGLPISSRSDKVITAVLEQEQPTFPGASILLVEDNPISQQVATELLQSAQVSVSVAGNGREALEKVRSSRRNPPFDLVLMDLQMPEMDGYEAARALRADTRYDDMPIVAMTAHAMVEERQKCLEAGMDDHISKPIEVDKFFDTLSRWVRVPPISSGDAAEAALAGEPAMDEASSRPDSFASVAEGALCLPGLDVKKALARLGNNERLYVKLLKQFLKYYSNTEGSFQQALDSGDIAGAQRLIHTLKGLAGAIGATSLANESGFLEASFHSGDMGNVRSMASLCFATLDNVLVTLRHAFNTAVDQEEPAAEEMGDPEDSPAMTPEQGRRKEELLDALAVYLADDDATTVSFFTDHASELGSLIGGKALAALKRHIEKFEFEEALKSIRLLRDSKR